MGSRSDISEAKDNKSLIRCKDNDFSGIVNPKEGKVCQNRDSGSENSKETPVCYGCFRIFVGFRPTPFRTKYGIFCPEVLTTGAPGQKADIFVRSPDNRFCSDRKRIISSEALTAGSARTENGIYCPESSFMMIFGQETAIIVQKNIIFTTRVLSRNLNYENFF